MPCMAMRSKPAVTVVSRPSTRTSSRWRRVCRVQAASLPPLHASRRLVLSTLSRDRGRPVRPLGLASGGGRGVQLPIAAGGQVRAWLGGVSGQVWGDLQVVVRGVRGAGDGRVGGGRGEPFVDLGGVGLADAPALEEVVGAQRGLQLAGETVGTDRRERQV